MVEDIVEKLGYLTLGTRLKRLGERMQGDTQRILAGYELALPAAQFPFLAAIDRLGALSVGDLAKAVGVTQPGATRTVAQLEKGGLLKVVPAADDQRVKRVDLSTQGKRVVELGKRVAWPVIERAVRDLCEDLKGSLLEQLSAMEDGLQSEPLHRRAKRAQARRR